MCIIFFRCSLPKVFKLANKQKILALVFNYLVWRYRRDGKGNGSSRQWQSLKASSISQNIVLFFPLQNLCKCIFCQNIAFWSDPVDIFLNGRLIQCTYSEPLCIFLIYCKFIFQIHTSYVVDWLRNILPAPPAWSFGSLFKVSFIRMSSYEQELPNVLITTWIICMCITMAGRAGGNSFRVPALIRGGNALLRIWELESLSLPSTTVP